MQYVAIIGRGHRISDLDEDRGQCKEPLYEVPDGILPTQYREGLFLNDALGQFIATTSPVGTATVSYSWDGEDPDRVEDVDMGEHYLAYEDSIDVVLVYTEEYLEARDGPIVESAQHEFDYGI